MPRRVGEEIVVRRRYDGPDGTVGDSLVLIGRTDPEWSAAVARLEEVGRA